MTEVEKILKYQSTDAKLIQIDCEVTKSEERKNFMQAVNYVTKATERMDALDSKALVIKARMQALSQKYDELADTLSEFENLDELLEGGADISFYKKNLAQLSERLKALRQEMNALNKAIKESDEEFNTIYRKYRAMQKQGKEYQEVYEKYKAAKRAESESVRAELLKLEKDISPTLMQSYKAKRSERVFPILCPEKQGRCSKCGNELSLAGKENIAAGKIVECDNCHTFLYKG